LTDRSTTHIRVDRKSERKREMRKRGGAPDGQRDERSFLRNQPSMVGLDGSVRNSFCREVHFGYRTCVQIADLAFRKTNCSRLARARLSSPSGTVRWTARKAPSIRNDVTYAGAFILKNAYFRKETPIEISPGGQDPRRTCASNSNPLPAALRQEQ
jgi:hypothetical protein